MFDTDDIRMNPELEPEEELLPDAQESAEDVYEYETEELPRRKKGKKGVKILIGAVAALVVILAAAALWVNANYVIAGGLHPRDAQWLDLREKSISVKNYEKLSRELPGCDIRWGVPISGERYDSQATELVVPQLKGEEIGLFAHFTALETLDVTGAELSVADFEALSEQLPGCYIRWNIPIGGARYDSAAAEIAVSDFTAEEVELFTRFDALTTVDATGCRCYDEILALQALLPETKVLWNVELDGELLHQDTAAITVDGSKVDFTALQEYLRRLPALEQVTVDNCALTTDEQTQLLAAYPEVAFTWPVELLGEVYDSSVTELSYAQRTDMTAEDLQEISEALPRFHSLEVLDLSGCGFTAEQILPLYEQKPDLDIYWEFELYGKTFSTTDKEMELSNIKIEDLAPLEEAIARMPFLEKVIMCDCGLSNKTMDDLNKKYENIRFVWMLHFKGFEVRTDAVGFIANGNEYTGHVTQQDVDENLIYCTDILSLDLGHKGITDLSFVQYMPKLKYLLLGATQVTDLSPLAQLEDLIFLELQLTSTLSDLEPLLDCKSLKDLNIGYIATGHGQAYYDVLSQMTWLERLWYSDHLMNDDLDYKLKEALPDCILHVSVMPDFICGAGWRTHDRYYEMRDLLGMYYMNEWGNEMGWRMVNGKYMLLRDYKAMIAAQEAAKEAEQTGETTAEAAEG